MLPIRSAHCLVWIAGTVVALDLGASAARAQTIAYPNLLYATHHDPLYFMALDLYLPSNHGGPWPTIIWIHGGSWSGGSRTAVAPDVPVLCPAGYAIASVSYRFSQQALWPAQMHDIKGAVRWLRSRAGQYDLDPNRFISWGDSAGGHLAAVLATTAGVGELEGTVGGNLNFSSRVQGCVDFFGPTRFLAMLDWHLQCNSSTSRLIGRCHGEILAHINDPEWAYWVHQCQTADPSWFATNDDGPFFILHSMADTVVEPQQSIILADALVAQGGTPDFRLTNGPNHARTESDTASALQFLQTHWPPPPVPPNDPTLPPFASPPPPPPPPPVPPPCADVSLDGAVGLPDMSEVIIYWATACRPGETADANYDGVVDLKDIALVIDQWDTACDRQGNEPPLMPPPPPPPPHNP